VPPQVHRTKGMELQAHQEQDAHESLGTVLLVEDEVLVRMDIADELRRHGFKVIEVATADDAIDTLKSVAAVDVVLTDVNMPGRTNGLDLARYVASTKPATKVAVMSAHLPEVPEHAQLFDVFLPKPFLPEALIGQIQALLDRHEIEK
jgi:two-component system, response regulator PdtaR